MERWVLHLDADFLSTAIPFPKFVIRMHGYRKLRKQTYAQGFGRHSEQELWSMFTKDMEAIAEYLGIIVVAIIRLSLSAF